MNSIEAIAQDVLSLMSKRDWIRLAAAKGIELKVDGTTVRITPQGLTVFTNGQYLVHAASHATDAPQGAPVQFTVTQDNPGTLVAHHVLVDDVSGLMLPNQPYRLTLDDGQVIQGVTNDLGELELAASNTMIWRDDSLPAPETMPNPEKRTTQVGGQDGFDTGAVYDYAGQAPDVRFVRCDELWSSCLPLHRQRKTC